MHPALRFVGRVVLRRALGWITIALLTALFAGRAHAQLSSSSTVYFGDQGEAYSACMRDSKIAYERAKVVYSSYAEGYNQPTCDPGGDADFGFFVCIVRNRFSGNIDYRCQENTKQFYAYPVDAKCTKRNSTFPPGDKAAASPMPWPSCVAGCKLYQENVSFSQPGGVMLYGRRNASYTGDICQSQATGDAIDTRENKDEQPKPSEPECTALGGGQTACHKPNGEYCATASTGKTFCWQPQEAGKKVDGSDAQVKSKTGEPVTPPSVSIEDKDWQRKEGHQATACINNTCTTYNVTNYGTVPGGTAKNSTGDNKTDGTGNTSGNGTPQKGEGDKGENGEGDSASDSGNCEVAPACTGDTLKCLHLRYTWKIECNSRSSEITNGDGCGNNDVPVCAGKSCKAEAYSQLLQQWKQRCAMQAMGEGMASRAAGIGGSNGDDAGVVEGIWGGEDGGSGLTLRRDLISVAGGGNLLPTGITIEGQAWEVPQGFYDAIAAIRMVIIAMCTVMAMFIVGRSI